MSEEYQRLQEAASAVESKIRELEQNHSISSAAGLAALERRLDLLAVKQKHKVPCTWTLKANCGNGLRS